MHKSTTEKIANIGTGAKVRYRTGARNPDGSTIWFREWDHNLILDSGLNRVPTDPWVRCISYAAVGTGTNPVERDSGATTFTAAAGVVTASAGFFEAGDVGRLLRLDTGEQGYITAFTSSTLVNWNGVDVGAGQLGTVYYVNRTALQTESKRTNTYRTSSGDNSSTWGAVNGEWTFQRTFLFSAESGSVTYREVGWSWGSGATNLFGMDVFSGGGDSLVSGQQYLIQVQLILRLTPLTSTTAPDVGTGGWNTEGDITLRDIGINTAFIGIDTNGNETGARGCLEPAFTQASSGFNQINFASASFSMASGATDGDVASAAGLKIDASAGSYVSGNFYRDYSATASVSQANGSIYGFQMCGTPLGSSVALQVLFDTPQTKDNVHTITARFRYTWNRRF